MARERAVLLALLAALSAPLPAAPGQLTSSGEGVYRGEDTTYGENTTNSKPTTYGEETYPGEVTTYGENTTNSKQTTYGEETYHGEDTNYSENSTNSMHTTYSEETYPGEDTTYGENTTYSKHTTYDEHTTYSKRTAQGEDLARGGHAALGQDISPERSRSRRQPETREALRFAEALHRATCLQLGVARRSQTPPVEPVSFRSAIKNDISSGDTDGTSASVRLVFVIPTRVKINECNHPTKAHRNSTVGAHALVNMIGCFCSQKKVTANYMLSTAQKRPIILFETRAVKNCNNVHHEKVHAQNKNSSIVTGGKSSNIVLTLKNNHPLKTAEYIQKRAQHPSKEVGRQKEDNLHRSTTEPSVIASLICTAEGGSGATSLRINIVLTSGTEGGGISTWPKKARSKALFTNVKISAQKTFESLPSGVHRVTRISHQLRGNRIIFSLECTVSRAQHGNKSIKKNNAKGNMMPSSLFRARRRVSAEGNLREAIFHGTQLLRTKESGSPVTNATDGDRREANKQRVSSGREVSSSGATAASWSHSTPSGTGTDERKTREGPLPSRAASSDGPPGTSGSLQSATTEPPPKTPQVRSSSRAGRPAGPEASVTPRHVSDDGAGTAQRSRTAPLPDRASTAATPPEDEWNATLRRFSEAWPVASWEAGGLFTADFLRGVDRHWLRFPPPSAAAYYAMAAVYSVVVVVGVVGNLLVITMFIRCRSLRTPGNILVVNLAVSDCLLVGETSMLIYNSLHRGPALGDVGCQVYGFVGGLAGTVSICSLTFIALDRYHVIVYPLDARRRTGNTQALLYVSLAWLYSALFASLPLTGLGVGRYVPEGFLTSCSFDYLSQDAMNRNFILAFCVAAWVLPFCIISYCYTRICMAVLKARHSGQGWVDDSSKHCKDQEKHRLELRLATVVLAVVGLWFVSWTPYAVVALMGVLGLHAHITPLSSMLPAAFCKTASCIDPFVYAVTHPRFRQELLAMTGLGCKARTGRRKVKKKKLRAVTAAESRDLHQESDIEEIIMVGVLGCTVRSTHPSRSYASSSSSSSSSSKLSLHEGGETSAPQAVTEAKRAERRNSRKRPYLTRGNPSLSFEDTTAGFALPSWFVSPKPRKNRSTSLRHKDRKSEDC